MMPQHLKLMFLLHSRTRIHKYRVKKAKERVEEWLDMVDNPYVAFSTGKDSTVILHLVRSIKPNIPYVYFDADSAFPESVKLLDALPNGIRFPTKRTYLEILAEYGINNPKIDKASMEEVVYEPIRRLITKYRFDSCCYGIRQEENHGRMMSGRIRGHIFHMKRDDLIMCQPVHDWKRSDIWSYIVSNDVPYCGYYDHLWDMPEEDQRLSYWSGETKFRHGRYAMLKRNYPELYNKLLLVVPEVANYT